MNFGKWSLYAKIYLMIGMLVFTGGLTTAISISGIDEVIDRMKEMADVHYKIRGYASNILDAQRVMLIANRNLILRTEEKDIKKVAEEFERANHNQDELIKELESLSDERQRPMVESLAATKIKWLAVVKQFQALASQNKNQEATAVLYGDAAKLTAQMNQAIDDIKADAVKRAQEEMQVSLQTATRTKSSSFMIGGVSLFVVMLFVFFLVRSLKSSIQKVVDDLSSAAQQIAAASTQVASSSEELSQSVTEQASSLEQTAASIEEISSMVKKSTENAQLSATTSVSAQQKAFDGKKTVERMLSSMNEIDESNSEIMRQTEESNRQTADILKVIQEIGAKTKVINDIVFQTKLLSFNASVEAARAGEQGKGFAVVAEEVGNLAQMSGNAAKEISEMLDTSMRKVEGITRENKEKIDVLITRGKSKVQSGVDTARLCAEVLDEIVQNVSRVSSMAGEISTANQEQSQGISEINKAVGQLDQVTQQNAATGSQTANAAELMSTQVNLLKNTVDRLVATIEGASQAARSAETPAPAPALQAAPAPQTSLPENRRQARAS